MKSRVYNIRMRRAGSMPKHAKNNVNRRNGSAWTWSTADITRLHSEPFKFWSETNIYHQFPTFPAISFTARKRCEKFLRKSQRLCDHVQHISPMNVNLALSSGTGAGAMFTHLRQVCCRIRMLCGCHVDRRWWGSGHPPNGIILRQNRCHTHPWICWVWFKTCLPPKNLYIYIQ